MNFYRAGLSTYRSAFIPGNQVTLLHNGDAYFSAIETAFDRARHEIYLATYIYQDDATGQRVADALQRAVLRGVKVHVLIDGYGSRDLPRSMLDRLRMGGVEILIFRRNISPWTFRRKRLRRMHRKMVVVDRELAFIGGINIIDDREAGNDKASRYDYAVAVQGPLVGAIHHCTRHLWSMVAWNTFHKGTMRDGALPVPTFTGGRMNAAFLMRDNFHHRRDIEVAYIGAIRQAKTEIVLAHAYFLPGRKFRHALIDAAARGVRVVLLMQGKMEYMLEYYAARALYGTFLNAGIEIYEYSKGFLHSKVAVIDGHWATVGSSNIDPFSLLLSLEANVVVDDQTFGEHLAASLKKTVATDGRQILTENWHHQPAGLRFISWISYGLLRLMMGISGYALENRTARNQSGPEQVP